MAQGRIGRWVAAGVAAVAVLLSTGVASAGVRIDRDLAYFTTGGETLRLDVYAPEAEPEKCPVVLLLHGGGWAIGDKKEHYNIGRSLAQAGFIAVSANYRLAPKHPYPAAVDDCRAALAWVRENAEDYNGDPARLGLMGESAGGHLSSLVALSDDQSTPSGVRAVVNLFGPSDLTKLWEVEGCQGFLRGWFGGPPSEHADAYRKASPVTYLKSGMPAFLHIHGAKDKLVPVEQTKSFHEALKAAGADSTIVIYEDAEHGWHNKSKHASKSREAALDFFKEKLRAK